MLASNNTIQRQKNSRVLVVVVTYNSEQYLTDCFTSLVAISYPQEQYDILVIDNASSDRTVAEIATRWPRVTVNCQSSNTGFAVANNIGMQWAIDNGYEFVYLLNHDTAVEKDFLTQAVEVMSGDETIGAVQSKLLLFDEPELLNSSGNHIHFLGFGFAGGYKQPDTEQAVTEITYPSGAAVLLRSSALRAVGLFQPEFFMYHEDLDLGWRLWLGGYRSVLAPGSVVYHKYEFSRSIRKYYFMERNRQLVFFQNYHWLTIILLLPIKIAIDISMLAYAILGGWWREELRVWRYFLKPKHWRNIFVQRRIIQSRRVMPERFVVDRFVGVIAFQGNHDSLITKLTNPLVNLYWQLIKVLIRW